MAKKKKVKPSPDGRNDEKCDETIGGPDGGPSFEASLAELEKIVGELELGELPLADALGRYEQAVAHLKSCQARLTAAEGRIEQLSGVDADGNAITTPFSGESDEPAPSEAKSRPRRRGTKSAGVDGEEQLF